MFDPATKASISALGMEQSKGTSKQQAMRNAELQDPFFLLNPTPDHTARSSLEASTRTHKRIFLSSASMDILGLLNFIPLHRWMSRKLRTHLALSPAETGWSHLGVSVKASLKSRLHLAVRGISMPLMSKTPMCLLVICLLFRDLGTKSSMSLPVMVSPEKVLVLGASLPLIICPKCRGCNLSSSVSVRGCHAFPATPTNPSSDISGAGSWPDIAQPFIFAPSQGKGFVDSLL